MSTIQYPITLDLRRNYHQVIVMKEGDVDSREIIVTIVDNGIAVTTYKTVDPVNVEMKVSMVGMPSFERANEVVILDVK